MSKKAAVIGAVAGALVASAATLAVIKTGVSDEIICKINISKDSVKNGIKDKNKKEEKQKSDVNDDNYEEITFDKEERKEIKDDPYEVGEDLPVGTFDEILKSYVHAINQWYYADLKKLSHVSYSGFSGSQTDWNDMDGSVVSAKIIEDNENQKLLRFKFDITNTGKSTLKKGINEKYVYFVKCKDKWVASPMFDEIGDISEPKEETVEDSTFPVVWEECINGGFGYKNVDDYYLRGVRFCNEISIDLNNDGKEETISVSKPENQDTNDYIQSMGDPYNVFDGNFKIYINKGKENEIVYDWMSGYGVNTCFNIYDLDKKDGYKELVFSSSGPSGQGELDIFRYDGKNLKKMDFYKYIIQDSIKGDGTFKISCQNDFINSYDVRIDAKLEGDKIIIPDQWVETPNYSHVLLCNLTVYEKDDTSSKKTTIKTGSTITFGKYYDESLPGLANISSDESRDGWHELSYNGKTYYVHVLNGYVDNDGMEVYGGNVFDNLIMFN